MKVFLNGKFVAEKDATISVLDRGFLYGDGLFEGVLIKNGRPFRWPEHMERLANNPSP
jgi:branched-subunit amino acid aminotransferase/4-amino-4-deoxychorismate lyase